MRPILPLVGACALLVIAIVTMAVFVSEQERNAADVLQAVDLRDAGNDVLSVLKDAETGQRGYLISGDEAYLAPYNSATVQIDTRLDHLTRAYADQPASTAALTELKSIVADKLAELELTVELRRTGQAQAAVDRVKTNRGMLLMRRARTLIAGLDAESYRLILDRKAKARDMGRLVEIASTAAILAAIAIALVVLVQAHRREMRLARTIVDLGSANTALSLAGERRDHLEAQLRQSQKMEAVGQLTGGLAHDFNNMLAVIISSLNMIKRKMARGDPGVGLYVDYAFEGAERAVALTQRLLAFSRRQALSPAPVDLNRLVPDLSEMLRRTLGDEVRMETILSGNLWSTMADVNQLESALVNLAVNARDAMTSGGSLTIETANADLDDTYARENDTAAGQYVMMAVTDSGSGMTPDVLAKAFDPFFTTKGVGLGSGLGLSQVYGFVKQSGGHIKIYSEVGKGTTIKLYLPRSFTKAVPTTAKAPLPVLDIPTGSPREMILVVEDEDRVRRLTVDCLRDLKYSVVHTGDGEDALRLLDTCPGIVLLFTDVVMPGLNGKQLADAARRRRPELKILFTTGYTRNAIVHNGVLDSQVDLISKPFNLPQLGRKVRQVIDAPQA